MPAVSRSEAVASSGDDLSSSGGMGVQGHGDSGADVCDRMVRKGNNYEQKKSGILSEGV